MGAVSIDGINITEAIANAKAAIDSDKTLSPGTRSVIEVLLLVVTLLSNRMGVNSKNSSKPPSSDPNREKKTRKKSNKPQGGQEGHAGSTLEQVENPDQTNELKLNRKALPPGQYMSGGYECRQVVEIEISRLIIEYQAEVLIDEKGK
ncbi:MAG: IS66 family transposase, partial [Alteromonadaceae bacterium]